MNITIDEEVVKELEYIVELHSDHGAANTFSKVEDLVSFILASIAAGSRRPGAWERQMLEMMGLIADCDEHSVYRENYGKSSPE